MSKNQKVTLIPIALAMLLTPIACARKAAPLPTEGIAGPSNFNTPSMTMAWTVPLGTTTPTETRTPTYSPTPIPPSATPSSTQSRDAEISTATEGTPVPEESVFDEFEFNFGAIQAWVKVVYYEDPAFSGIGWGSAMIYADSTEKDLLWKSPRFEDVNPANSNMAADSGFGYPILLIGWGVGMHGVRYYPVVHLADGFQMPPIIGEDGYNEEGFFSDGGGVIPWPGGWILAGRRIYDGPNQSEIYVYRFDGKRYYLARIITTEEEMDKWIRSLTPTGSPT
jgi:hypothetical protein